MVGSALVTLATGSGLSNDLFGLQISFWDKVIRTVVVYLGILLIIRVAGKRLMAQMNSMDLVVVLLLSNVVQNAIIGQDNSLIGGLIGAAVLVVVNAGLDRLAQRSPAVDWLLNGKPTTVVTDGVSDERALSRLGITPEELDNAIHQQGADSVSQVAHAAMEPGGTLTVRLEPGARSASIDDLRRAVDELAARIDAQRA
jgi:uncharacterized membrane protein YcaP (DUF421 family)